MPVPKMKTHPMAVCHVCKEQGPCVSIPHSNEDVRGTIKICDRCLREAIAQIDIVLKGLQT
jgi:hypothetical protein